MHVELKQGDGTAIYTCIERGRDGILVNVRVLPEVEEFFRHWGGDNSREVTMFGPMWKPWPPKAEVPRVWDMMNIQSDEESSGFDIYSPGTSIIASPRGATNISFIRLVGASRPEGVTFLCEDVSSTPGLERLSERIRRAGGRFCDNYLKPVKFHIWIDTKIVKGEEIREAQRAVNG